MLTPKQLDLLKFICEYSDTHGGVMPNFEEMAQHRGCSKGRIGDVLNLLAERGFIRRLPNRTRAIEILQRPESSLSGRDAAAAHVARAMECLPRGDDAAAHLLIAYRSLRGELDV